MRFMLFDLPTIPAESWEEREQLKPIGRNRERYQKMLDEVRTVVKLADQAGFEVFGTTEHHFHSEGAEASVAPLLLYTDLAARTERIKFAPLGLVLAGWDPIRCAEELAVFDNLTKGRLIAGFARGYQDRWVNVMGQQYHVTGAPMDGGEIDNHNRAVFEEAIDIIRKAWTQDTINHDGKFYKIPYPYEEGITRWPAAEYTRKYGAPGEVDEKGVIRNVCVIPRPYQDPHPPMMQPFGASERTIINCAKNNITPWVLNGDPTAFRGLCKTFQDAAKEAGRNLRYGQGIGAVRSVHFGDTKQEAVDLLAKTNFESFNTVFGSFGFFEAHREPADNEKYPLDPYTPLPPEEWTVDRMLRTKYALAGTVDDVKREFESLAKMHEGDGELEWFGWFFDQGLMSLDEQKRQIELFAEHIIPEFGSAPSVATAAE